MIVHELGHTYGVSEEGSAWICDPRCHAQPYMNPFSVMGHGQSDFGAWEKRAFGWLERIGEPAPRLTLGAIDRPASGLQAMRVLTAGDEYWFEYRPPAPLSAYNSNDAAPGVAVHAGSNGLGEPSRYPGRNFLLYDPVGRGRPSVESGETFSVRGAFAVRVVSAGAESAELSFRWTDRTRPARPRIVGAGFGAAACSSRGDAARSGGAGSLHTRSSSTAGRPAGFPRSGRSRTLRSPRRTRSLSGSDADAIGFGSSRSTGPGTAAGRQAAWFRR